MKVFTEIEILILLVLIIIAIVAGYFQRKRRAKRKAILEKESEIQNKVREKRKAHERKEPLPKKEPLAKAETAIVYGAHVPEDSMLRRHYISHLQSIIVCLTGPRPTDSALSRHYDTQVASELEKSLQDEAHARRLVINHEEQFRKSAEKEILQPSSIDAQLKAELAIEKETVKSTAPVSKKVESIGNHIPQDSTLRRHYIHHLRSMIESQISPTESNYDTMIEIELDKCLQNEAQVHRITQDYEKLKKN